MTSYKQEFIHFMVRSGVLTFGDFTAKSGRKTPYFVNTGNYKTGEQIAKLGEFYASCIKENLGAEFDALFGPAYKGIPPFQILDWAGVLSDFTRRLDWMNSSVPVMGWGK